MPCRSIAQFANYWLAHATLGRPRLRGDDEDLLRRRHPQHAPLRQQRAQRRRLDRLVQHLDALRARLLAHRRRAVGGDQDRRQVAAALRAAPRSPRCRCRGRDGSRPASRSAWSRLSAIAASAMSRSGALITSQPQPCSSVSMPSSTEGSLSMQSAVVPASWPGSTRVSSRAGSSTGAAFERGTVTAKCEPRADGRIDLDRRSRARAPRARRSTGRGPARARSWRPGRAGGTRRKCRAACDSGMPTPVS